VLQGALYAEPAAGSPLVEGVAGGMLVTKFRSTDNLVRPVFF